MKINNPFRQLYIPILVVVAAFLTGCSTVLLTGRKQLTLVSDSEVLAFSDSSYRSYLAGAKLSSNATQQAMVNRVGTRLVAAVQTYLAQQGKSDLLNGYQWQFRLVVDTAVNAFCMPGGKIVVYDGLLPVTKTEAGLAVVVGHEIAHAIAKHANERLSQQLALQYGATAVDALLEKKSVLTRQIGSVVFGLGAEYGVMLPYSRTQEYEADELGLLFMAMAGYDPNEAIAFWTRMTANAGQSVPEILSTHPSDAHRIAKLKEALPKALAYYQPK